MNLVGEYRILTLEGKKGQKKILKNVFQNTKLLQDYLVFIYIKTTSTINCIKNIVTGTCMVCVHLLVVNMVDLRREKFFNSVF